MVYDMLDRSTGLFDVSISSDSPAQAGYEPQSVHHSQAGFLAAYFIKPPVSLKVSFNSPSIVQVQKISFCPRIGKQCSTAATIAVRTHSLPDRLIQVWRGTWDAQISEIILDGSANFRPNRVFPSLVPSSLSKASEEKHGPNFRTFVLAKNSALGEVTEITLTITRTDVSTAVALRDLRIYGQPSQKNSKDALQSFLQRIPRPVAEGNQKKRAANNAGEEESVISKRLCLVEPSSLDPTTVKNIPESFLDALTYEIMMDPVILPSGHKVDMSSIKNHERIQRELGRRLFDPFTGIQCTYAGIRSDAELKQTINEFLKDRGETT